MDVRIHQPGEAADEAIAYVVIAARYQDKWIFCRHRSRESWELPGGHRELGESSVEAARRELYEETGALEAEWQTVAAYSVATEKETTWGMLYLAHVKALGPLPEGSEIGEICLRDTPPIRLTYPAIQPLLYRQVQGWLNFQSGAGEPWDVYDVHRRPTGRIMRRGDPIAPGDYHLVVHLWIEHTDGRFLLTQRSANKGYPLLWEGPGGSAVAGDDSLAAALREAREETGLVLDPAAGKVVLTVIGDSYIGDVWHFRQEVDLDKLVLLPGETCAARLATREEILNLHRTGELVPYRYLDQLFENI